MINYYSPFLGLDNGINNYNLFNENPFNLSEELSSNGNFPYHMEEDCVRRDINDSNNYLQNYNEKGKNSMDNNILGFENLQTGPNSQNIQVPNNDKNSEKQKEIFANKNSIVIQKEKYNEKSSKFNQGNFNQIKNNNETTYIKKEKKRGRKLKSSSEKRKNNKFRQDNMIRRIKTMILKNIYNYLNSFINAVYNGNIGDGKNKKKLLKLRYKQVLESKADENINFLKKTLKDLFSDNITTKYKNFGLDFNKNLIEKLLKEEDENKKIIFEEIFNLTFLECLKHIIGSQNIELLNGINGKDGIDTLDKIVNNLDHDDDEEYKEKFKKTAQNFEKIITSIKKRKKKRVNNLTDNNDNNEA